MEYIADLLFSIILAHTFTGLLTYPMKFIKKILLILCDYIIFVLFTNMGQWVTPFILITNILYIYFTCDKRLLDVILSLFGYVTLVLIDHILTIPLAKIGYTIFSIRENYILYFMITELITILLLLWFIRKFILSKYVRTLDHCPKEVLQALFIEVLICVIMLVTNIIFSDYIGYSTPVLIFITVQIFFIILSNIVILYHLHNLMKKSIEIESQKMQHEIMLDYTNRIELLIGDIRAFRHDCQNILATMQDYIYSGNIIGLKEYYEKQVLPETKILSHSDFYLTKLSQIKDPAIKSIYYTKIISILNKNINFSLEIPNEIPNFTNNTLTLSRVLGIFMDNAIEATVESEKKTISFSISQTASSIIFIFSNSTSPLNIPFNQLDKRGITSKKGHSGIGLSYVTQVMNSTPEYSLSTMLENDIFKQIFICQKGES